MWCSRTLLTDIKHDCEPALKTIVIMIIIRTKQRRKTMEVPTKLKVNCTSPERERTQHFLPNLCVISKPVVPSKLLGILTSRGRQKFYFGNRIIYIQELCAEQPCTLINLSYKSIINNKMYFLFRTERVAVGVIHFNCHSNYYSLLKFKLELYSRS